MADGSVKTMVDLNGDRFFNPGFGVEGVSVDEAADRIEKAIAELRIAAELADRQGQSRLSVMFLQRIEALERRQNKH